MSTKDFKSSAAAQQAEAAKAKRAEAKAAYKAAQQTKPAAALLPE